MTARKAALYAFGVIIAASTISPAATSATPAGPTRDTLVAASRQANANAVWRSDPGLVGGSVDQSSDTGFMWQPGIGANGTAEARALPWTLAERLIAPLDAGTTRSASPVPYSPDEFPLWAKNLRRAEIVTIGVFPFTLLYTSLAYDLVRFVAKSVQAGTIDLTYAPWFFAGPNKPPLSPGENLGVLLSASGLAVVVGIVDFLLGRAEAGRAGVPRPGTGSTRPGGP